MSTLPKLDDLYKNTWEKSDRHEILWRALDRAAAKGKIRPDAVELLHGMFADRTKLVNGEFILLNLPLDEAIEKIVQRMPLVQPPKDDPRIVEAERLEAEALQGSVQAHGALWRKFVAQAGGNERLGDAAYNEWCASNKAKPGLKAAVDAADKVVGDLTADDLRKAGVADNPFSATGWNKTKQGAVHRADPGLAARLSAEAGWSSLDAASAATKPLRAA